MNLNYMYSVLCESEEGLDAFGNPIGEPILFETIGKNLCKYKAFERAKELKKSGRFGDVKVVRLEVCELKLD